LLIAHASDAKETSEALLEMASRRLRGLALVPPSDNYKVPVAGNVVALASPCHGALYIAPDETHTGHDGTEYLWSLGHRRIAFITYSRNARAIHERRKGYEDFMKSMGWRP